MDNIKAVGFNINEANNGLIKRFLDFPMWDKQDVRWQDNLGGLLLSRARWPHA